MNLIFHPEASEEMLESARFYELRSEGLGSDFLTAVEDTTRRILELPTLERIEKATYGDVLGRDFRSPFSTNHIKIISS